MPSTREFTVHSKITPPPIKPACITQIHYVCVAFTERDREKEIKITQEQNNNTNGGAAISTLTGAHDSEASKLIRYGDPTSDTHA